MYLSRRFLKWQAMIFEAPPIQRVSSSNSEWLMFLTPFSNLIPVMRPIWQLKSRALLKYSAINIKRYGEIGQPCLSPWVDWKEGLGIPLMRGEIEGPVMQALTRSMKDVENPIFSKTINKKECLTQSKALAKSNFKMNPFSFLVWLEWMASWTRRMESEICLLAKKTLDFLKWQRGGEVWDE